MLKLNLCRGISRKFFYEANGLALSAAVLLFFSCNDEIPNSNEPEPEDVSVKEYAFINPDDTLNISLCEAEDIATLFMNELGGVDNTFKSKGLYYSSRKATMFPDDNMEPAVYAINLDPEGFCIVSATKKTETILAYSDQGKFEPDNLPIGLADWLSEKIELIQEVRGEASISSIKKTITSPEGNGLLPPGGREDVGYVIKTYGPLLKTSWGQGYPYNYQCPAKETCEHSMAGCVAIAAAQVVRYWEPKNSSYSWKEMPNSATGSEPTYYVLNNKGFSSMSQLIREIGDAVNMDYGCDGSGAQTRDIPKVLSQKYGFYNCGNYQEMKPNQAQSKVISNIKNKQPVIMKGQSGYIAYNSLYITGGHAWVCDGYKEIKKDQEIKQQLFHMNWGWDGKGDGWYTIDLKFDKSASHADGSDGIFVYLRGYITDIKATQKGNLFF